MDDQRCTLEDGPGASEATAAPALEERISEYPRAGVPAAKCPQACQSLHRKGVIMPPCPRHSGMASAPAARLWEARALLSPPGRCSRGQGRPGRAGSVGRAQPRPLANPCVPQPSLRSPHHHRLRSSSTSSLAPRAAGLMINGPAWAACLACVSPTTTWDIFEARVIPRSPVTNSSTCSSNVRWALGSCPSPQPCQAHLSFPFRKPCSSFVLIKQPYRVSSSHSVTPLLPPALPLNYINHPICHAHPACHAT